MLHLFTLGREPLLSTAEILSVLRKQSKSYTLKAWATPFCVIETPETLDYKSLMRELGGTIKISSVWQTLDNSQEGKNLNDSIKKQILDFLRHKGALERKVFFGLSFYNQDRRNKNLGLEIKKQLAEEGINSRLVTSHEETLSAVTIKKNKLLSERGAEIILATNNNQTFLAATLAIQPFEEFSRRDFGRPGRDSRSGMLPPKLAKIMINLAEIKTEEILLDPFCGSGTILSEAYLMGYKNLFGSDISQKAISDTEKNLSWSQAKAELKICDASQLYQCYPQNHFGAIVTEPFLGPPLKGRESLKEIDNIISELKKLYLASLKEMQRTLKKDGTIIMIWPVVNNQKMNLEEHLPSLGLKLENLLDETDWFKKQDSLIYSRPDQIVKREIVKIKKIAS